MPHAVVPLWEKPVLRSAAGETLRPGGFQLTDRAAESIGILPGWRVLDVGSGLGASISRLRSRFGAEVYGVEGSMQQIERGNRVPGTIQASGEVLPFQAACFDALFCECVFSLFMAPEASLVEFYRVLKPGGFLCLSDLCAREVGAREPGSCAQRAIPLAATLAMVENAGFAVLDVEDHSDYLKDLAARLIFAGDGSQSDCGCDRRGLGYYLMTARKRGAHDV